MKKLAILAVTAAALAAGKVEASEGGTNLVLTISGTVQYQLTNVITTNSISSNSISTTLTSKTKIESFNNATIYNMISNAVANVGNGISTNLPAKGIIEYNPQGFNGTNLGLFYVTDKTNGFYYPLSGHDVHGDYYSFIELDSYVVIVGDNDIELGFGYPFDGSASYTINKNGDGSLSGKDTALLYVHGDPYIYDVAENPNVFYDSSAQAFEIQGIMTAHLTYQTNSISGGTLSLTGTGNAIIPNTFDIYDASVISGSASLK